MDDKMPKCDFEAAMRWARTRLEFGSPSGPNETERDDNLARCYLAMSAQAPGMEAMRLWPSIETLLDERQVTADCSTENLANQIEALVKAALQAAEGVKV